MFFSSIFSRKPLPVSGEVSRSRRDSAQYDVILHIGAPKAGSSAIQAFLVKNRVRFEKCGYFYPEHQLDGNGVSGGHSEFGGFLLQNKLEKARAVLSKWLEEAEQKKCALLLSAESLYGKPKEIREITPGLRIKIVAFFRDPVEALISNHNQLIKRHFGAIKLYEYAHRQLVYDMDGISGMIFREWVNTFGERDVMVLPYVYEQYAMQRIEDSFLSALDITEQGRAIFSFPERRINASYTPEALELKRLFNHVLEREDPTYAHRIDWCLQKYSDDHKRPRVTAQKLLGQELCNAYANKFRESNDYLKKYILSSVPEGFLDYSDKPDMEPSCPQPSVPLEQVLKSAFSDQADILQYLSSRTQQFLDGETPVPYEVYRLAELLGLPFQQVNFRKAIFQPRQMDVLISEKSQPADLLREVSVMLEHTGQYEQALAVISRALALRPAGPAIIAAHERLLKKV